MPIDYSKYPPNWKTEIVPRILKRANNKCEQCGLENHSYVWSVKRHGKSSWHKDKTYAECLPATIEMHNGRLIDNPKKVKVVLTVAHLNHDETNHNVKDEDLKALCQLCHLRYDAKEKYKRAISKSNRL